MMIQVLVVTVMETIQVVMDGDKDRDEDDDADNGREDDEMIK